MWWGQDEVLRRPVAVKEIFVPLPGGLRDRVTMRSRVLREARALARLDSPAIVTVFDVVEETHRHWIVMELVESETLAEAVHVAGSLPPAQVAAIGLALIEALGAAHSVGILHRDVKPGNVLLARDGRVRLTDFGIATTQEDTTLTDAGALVGSPAYIAPERVRGASGSPASDLWGLAATLYAAVEGYPPFEGRDMYTVLRAVVEGRRRPFALAGLLGAPLAAVLDHGPQDRPSLAELRRWLRPIAGRTSATAVSLTPAPPTVIVEREPVDAMSPGTEIRDTVPPAAPEWWPSGGADAAGGLRGPLLASLAAAAVIATTVALSGLLAPVNGGPGAAAAATPAATPTATPRAAQPFAAAADESTAVTSPVRNDHLAVASPAGAVVRFRPRTAGSTDRRKPAPAAAPARAPAHRRGPATEPPSASSSSSPSASNAPGEAPSSPPSPGSSTPPGTGSPRPANSPTSPVPTQPTPTVPA